MHGETPEAFINAVISRIVGSHRDVDFDGKRDVVKDIPSVKLRLSLLISILNWCL